MLLTPGGKKSGDRANKNHILDGGSKPKIDIDDGGKPKVDADDGNTTKADADEGSSAKPRSRAPEKKPRKGKDGEAFADDGDVPIRSRKERGSKEMQTQGPSGTFRDKNGRLRNDDGSFAKDPNTKGKANDSYRRSLSERKKALLRDANDPSSDLSPEAARQYIKDNNGSKVPEGYEVSHEEPLYTRGNNEGKKEIDVADNMKTQPKDKHRARHKICGDQYHDYGPSNKPKIIR